MFSSHSRRQFILWGVAAYSLTSRVAKAALPGQQQAPKTFPPPLTNNPNPRRDASEPGDASPPAPDPKTVLKANDKDIKQNVARLASLAEELKKEVESTDSSSVLSLGMVHKAEEIEKLAKHIASLARG